MGEGNGGHKRGERGNEEQPMARVHDLIPANEVVGIYETEDGEGHTPT
jgi:hypothetical protein